MFKVLCLLAVCGLLLTGCQQADDPAETVAGLAGDAAVTEPTEQAADDDDLPPVPGAGIDPDRYAGHLATLASDEFEGRAPGTRGERLTLDYLVSEFSALGLEPGYGDTFLQPVPMVEMTNEAR